MRRSWIALRKATPPAGWPSFLLEVAYAVAPSVSYWRANVPHKLPDKPHWNHGQSLIGYRVPGKRGTSTDDSTGYDQVGWQHRRTQEATAPTLDVRRACEGASCRRACPR